MSQGQGGGRPPQFNPERCAKIIESISNRIPYIIAAEANGICEGTLYQWLDDGRKDIAAGLDTDKARFSEAIKNTEQQKIKEHLECIKNMPERWQAQAWILERRWWKHFSAKAEVLEFQRQLDEMKHIMERDNGKAQGENKK